MIRTHVDQVAACPASSVAQRYNADGCGHKLERIRVISYITSVCLLHDLAYDFCLE